MKTYKVQKRVETEKNTDLHDSKSFENLQAAESYFNETLNKQTTYAGEYNDGDFSEYYTETLEIESFDDETEDFETIKEQIVYSEGKKDKNNYKGDHANWYWFVAKFDGTELVYNFYDNGKDLNLQYEGVKESELSNWYNK